VRHFGKSALTAAIVGLTALASTPASAQESGGHRIAVVDVAKVFKEHKGIRSQIEEVEKELKAFDTLVKQKREALKQAAEKLKSFKVGTPEYTAQEEQVASMESRLRLDIGRKQKELAEAEARIYYENYKKIAEGVEYLAKYYKVNLVLRYNSEDMDLEKGESVIRGVMKNIVYHDQALDMTPGVMQYLDQQFSRVAGASSASQTK
jgi:Skp family chaperone for outer membrane proteins